MNSIKTYKDLVERVSKFKIDQNLDLSSGEDLSIGLMNLISIEEHLFFTSQKLKSKKYLEMLNEVRLMRTELMKDIVKNPEGEVWCISKHLLASSMRVMEVGTKELKKGNKKKANDLFEKSYKLYSLFWGLNLSSDSKASKLKGSEDKSVFSKLGDIVQNAIDCCRE
jgi:hypothetical protein